jgi:polyhydroxybutyrate depolymerase
MRRAGSRLHSHVGLTFLVTFVLMLACEGGPEERAAQSALEPAASDAPSPATAASPLSVVPTATAASADSAALVEARPYGLVVPEDVEDGEAVPLIVVLHGYGQGPEFAGYFNLDAVAAEHGAIVAYPLGTPDAFGRRFWNATDVCCDFLRRGVDDVAYISAVIDDVASKHRVDARRIFVVGYSNGAFMAQRLACEIDERIAAVVAVAGVNWLDPAMCAPSEAVSVLQVHGDADPIVQYIGGRMADGAQRYPSVQASIEGWRDRNGCNLTPEVAESVLDIASNVAGAETSVTRYEDCPAGGAAELWTVHGGDHDIVFNGAFAESVWEFLENHPKP